MKLEFALLIVALGLGGTPATQQNSFLKSAKPGAEARVAYDLLEQGNTDEACRAFLAGIRNSTLDPWSFAGVAHCAARVAGHRQLVMEALDTLPQDSALVSFARGYLHYLDSDVEKAEEWLRRAVKDEPDLALAWNILGAVVRVRDPAAASTFIETALELAPDLEIAQKNLDSTKLFVDAFEHLLMILSMIAQRWDEICEPSEPLSWQQPEELVSAASREERQRARALIAGAATTTPEKRLTYFQNEFADSPPTDVDLWFPVLVVQQTQEISPHETALVVGAWLQLAETVGRRDVLLVAATAGLDLAHRHLSPETTALTAQAWIELPVQEHTEVWHGLLLVSYNNILQALNQKRDALQYIRRARGLFEISHYLVGQAYSWYGEGEILFQLREMEKSTKAYQRARNLFEELGDPIWQANSWAWSGKGLAFLGRKEDALYAYEQSESIYEASNLWLSLGDVLVAKGAALAGLGRYSDALQNYRRARKVFRQQDFASGQGNSWLGEADILLFLGEYEYALEAVTKARNFFRAAGETLGEANSWVREGDILAPLGRLKNALEAYHTARTLSSQIDDLVAQSNTWVGEGDAYFELKENEKALRAYERARTLCEITRDRLCEGQIYFRNALIYHRLGDWENAAKNAATARMFFTQMAHLSGQLNAVLIEARARAHLREEEKVAQLAEDAIRLHGKCRESYVFDRHRIGFDQPIRAAYNFLIGPHIIKKRYRQALSLAESSHARSLLDLLTTKRQLQLDDSSVSDSDRNMTIEARMARTEKALHESPDPDEKRDLKVQIHALNREYEWNLFNQIIDTGRPLVTAEPLDAGAIHSVSQEAGPIILYYVDNAELIGFLIDPSRSEPLAVRIGLFLDDCRDMVRWFRTDLGNPLFELRAETRARELGDLLIAPFLDRIREFENLILIPHGPLHELPFAALLAPDGSHLFERWNISISPSVSTLAIVRQRYVGPDREDLILTLSTSGGLNWPDYEANEIKQFFEKSLKIQPSFRQYQEGVNNAHDIFIATRGVRDEESRSGNYYLELVPDDQHDSRLSAARIATIPVNAELVTLAACDSASGQALLSDDRLDLTRAFLIAGASSVLATRWKVPEDQRTSQFLIDFYRAYRRGGPDGKGMRKDEALTVARRLSRDRGDPAQVWAAWVLVGDPR